MLLNKKNIKKNQALLEKSVGKLEKMSKFNYLGADLTRIKIIFLLKIHKTLCPTDISQILKITISAVSHQMRILESSKAVKKIKMGRMICYSLNKDEVNAVSLLDLKKIG